MAISDYCQMIVNSLKTHLEFAKEDLRKVQVSGFEKLIDFVDSGKLNGLVKHPTGAGKTRFFSEVLAAVNSPSLILVPRVNLVSDTKDSLVGEEMRDTEGVGYLDEEVILLSDESGTASSGLKNIYDKITEREVFNGVVIMTYQSFQSISTISQSLLDDFMKIIKVVISDEAHKALGDKTQKSINQYVDDIIGDKYERLHLHVTATPHLSQKDVRDVYDVDVIDWVRVQDSVEDGILIMPQFRHIGTASYRTTNDIYFSDRFFDELASSEKFVMSNGQSVTEAVVNEYIKLKDENNGYLPGVAFCATIAHAQATKDYLESRGIRAIRCTSPNDKFDHGVTPHEAKQMFHDETVDVVVTVSKVGEGWDVPTLRCALWLKPVRSSSVFIQGTGRIMRTLLLNTIHAFKDRSNTFVIEPLWELVRVSDADLTKKSDDKRKKVSTKSSEDNGCVDKDRYVFPARNGYEHFIASDEYNLESLKKIAEVDARINVDINLHDDEHLRKLIKEVKNLIVDGSGIRLVAETFICKEYNWSVSGGVISNALFGKDHPNIAEAEKLALQLWPKETKKLLFNIDNDDHLRQLIGGSEYLIVNGKGISFRRKTFTCPERSWIVSGCVIGSARLEDDQPRSALVEKLALRLWPKEVKRLLFDINDDNDLRQLIGGPEQLIVDGKGLILRDQVFMCTDRNWEYSGKIIGHVRFGNKSPNAIHSIKLALQLWPRKTEKLLPKEDFDINNNTHLRQLIGGPEQLIVDGKGVRLKKKYFTCTDKRWTVSGTIITSVLFGKKHPNITETERLALRLWPKDAKRLLFDINNDNDLRQLIGGPEQLIVDGNGVPLRTKKFVCLQFGWKASGMIIANARFGRKAGIIESKKLALQLWPKEAKKLLEE